MNLSQGFLLPLNGFIWLLSSYLQFVFGSYNNNNPECRSSGVLVPDLIILAERVSEL